MKLRSHFDRTRKLLILLVLFAFAFAASAQQTDIVAERARALALAEDNRYGDVYPILDKIAPSFPNDAEVWTHYGISILVRSVTLSDPKERKEERKRAYTALMKAKGLGTENVLALRFLDQLPPDGYDEDSFGNSNPEVEKALREGEAHFGKGEYQKAFASYERAHKLDPKNYEAVLFMGDSLYAEKKYAESEPFFAQAAALAPDRETAYRFWGDALLNQEKLKEAREKFIDAFLAEPYSRTAWDNINKLTRKHGRQFNVKGLFPPGTDDFWGIVLDTSKLTGVDGTDVWLKYQEVRERWRRETFKQQFGNQPYRHSLKEETAALQAAAIAAKAAVNSGKIKAPHHSLLNLIDLSEKGMIEPYVLFMLANEGIAEDYLEYRKANRQKLRTFLSEHVFVF